MRPFLSWLLLLLLPACKTQLLVPDAGPPPDLAAPPFAQTCADPWPLVGHDAQHTGHGCTAGPTRPAIKWMSPQVSGRLSAPVVGGNGVVYAVADQDVGTATLHAFAPDDGRLLWQSDLGTAPSSLYDLGPVVGPGGIVYAIYQQGQLRSFDPQSGTPRWTANLCPVIDPWLTIGPDGTIYLGCGSNTAYAIRPSDGGVIWSSQLLDPNVIALSPDGVLLVATIGSLSAVTAATGKLRWGPIAAEGIGIVGSVGHDGSFYIIESRRTGHPGGLDALDPDSGALRWNFVLPDYEYAPPIGSDGTLYVNGASGLIALGPDGKERWQLDDHGVQFNAAGRIVDGDGTIFAFAQDVTGSVLLYSVTPNGKVNWTLPLGQVALRNPPALGPEGHLYVVSGNDPSQIIAFGK
jgi:outer membrane protein assembly factor BamB